MTVNVEIPATAVPEPPKDPVERAFDEDSITADTPTEWIPPAETPHESVPYPLRPA